MKKTAGFILFIAAVFLTLTFAFAEAEGLPPFLSGQNHDRPTGLSEPIAGETVIADDDFTIPLFRLPALLQIIEEEAFEGTAFVTVELPETVETIGEKAFANIPTLRSVKIPEKTREIAVTAFAGSDYVTIIAAPGSYARTWARENGVPFAPITVMFAGTGSSLISASAAGFEADFSLNFDSADDKTENRQWRPAGEIKADQYEQFIANHILGRAPPAGTSGTGMTA